MEFLYFTVFYLLCGTAMADPVPEQPSLREDISRVNDVTKDLDHQEDLNRARRFASDITSPGPTSHNNSPKDCSDIFAYGQKSSGVYTIYPLRGEKYLEVFCDMENEGGRWTVLLSRNASKDHINFNRIWTDYKEFFGIANGEYWIGNENLHALTSHRNYVVKWEAKDGEGRSTWEGWNSFSVASEENGYRLTLEGYDQRSTVREDNGFGINNGQNFSTFDNENDKSDDLHCAERHKGGWWYKGCSWINPTGIHGKKSSGGVYVYSWSKEDSSLRYPTWLQFKIRPTN